jgi:membrane-associated phospholipid phosphatase
VPRSPCLLRRLRRARLLRGPEPYVFGALLFALLGLAVEPSSPLVRLELALVRAMHDLVPNEVTALAGSITDLGGTRAILLVTATAAVSLLVRGQWHGAFALTVSVSGTQAIVFLLKDLYARARPPASTAVVDAEGPAFPSAHAASTAALYGLLAFFVLRRVRGRAQFVVAAAALAFVGLVGFTRVYLGAHYPTDVVAGWVVGALVAAAGWRLARVLRLRTRLARA